MADANLHDDPEVAGRVEADREAMPRTPRWVKVFGIIAIVVVLLFIILMLTRGPGGHGPGRHFGSGSSNSEQLRAGIAHAYGSAVGVCG